MTFTDASGKKRKRHFFARLPIYTRFRNIICNQRFAMISCTTHPPDRDSMGPCGVSRHPDHFRVANKPPEMAFVDLPEARFWTGGLECRITCAKKKQK